MSFNNLNYIRTISECYTEMNAADIGLLCKKLVPNLSHAAHKGTSGRIGVFGGSAEFTGAPYFSAISSLKTGADLVYVFSPACAAPQIKSYSPELMVMPYLDSDDSINLINPWLQRLHTLIVGPGLGKRPNVLSTVNNVMKSIKRLDSSGIRPLVFDADGLHYICKNIDLLKEYPGDIYLTPNRAEFTNIAGSILGIDRLSNKERIDKLVQQIGKHCGPKVTIILKGPNDIICSGDSYIECTVEGSMRRCGGQGDLLSGCLGTFAAWAAERKRLSDSDINPMYPDNILAAYSACALIRTCSKFAFEKKHRSMLATDMIEEIHVAFKHLFENDLY